MIRTLQEANQLLIPGDHPPQPSFVQGRTPLRKGQITTAALLEQFRSDTSLPMLGGTDLFVRLVRDAVDGGAWVYQRGELVGARGTPTFQVTLDEQSLILTADYARDAGIWPRPRPVRPPDLPPGDDPLPQGDDKPPPPPAPLPPPEDAKSAQGPLREALARVFDKARARRLAAVGTLEIEVYEPQLTCRCWHLPAASRRPTSRHS